MKIDWVTVGPFQENSYLVVDERSGKGVLIDPGDEPPRVVRLVRAAGVELDAVWLTHAHIDHIGALAAIQREWDVSTWMHPADRPLFERAAQQAAFYGLPFEPPRAPDHAIADGDVLRVGTVEFVARHTPGHAPGHVVFVGERTMIGGDLLFAGSIGRTDLPLSDPAAMERSLALVAAFDPQTAVYPGHGPPTSIGAELSANPFLAAVHHAT